MLRKYGRGILLSLSLLLATAALASGCGQKGPLYLPEEKYRDADNDSDTADPDKADKENDAGAERSASEPKKTGY